MRIEKEGSNYRAFVDSLQEFAQIAEIQGFQSDPEWAGGSLWDALRMLQNGWEEGVKKAMPIAENALLYAEKETQWPIFEAVWDVAGSEVDIARYLGGVPENMIEYMPIKVSKVGRTVAICVGIVVSAAISTDAMIRRGAAIMGLVMALEQLGHATEIWADYTVNNRSDTANFSLKIPVKAVHDVADYKQIAYCLGHPTMLRQLAFSCLTSVPSKVADQFGFKRGGGFGSPPFNPAHNLPEGTIYLNGLASNKDVPNAEEFVLSNLKALGLVAE